MTIDHNRTSKREKQKNNCHCSVVKWAPHQRSYCQAEEKRQFEES